MTDNPRAPKRVIPPRDKAQLALDVAQRKLDAANNKVADLTLQLRDAHMALAPLQAQVDYLAANPLLRVNENGANITIPAQQDPAEL